MVLRVRTRLPCMMVMMLAMILVPMVHVYRTTGMVRTYVSFEIMLYLYTSTRVWHTMVPLVWPYSSTRTSRFWDNDVDICTYTTLLEYHGTSCYWDNVYLYTCTIGTYSREYHIAIPWWPVVLEYPYTCSTYTCTVRTMVRTRVSQKRLEIQALRCNGETS